jgi:hypothetical protein
VIVVTVSIVVDPFPLTFLKPNYKPDNCLLPVKNRKIPTNPTLKLLLL